MAADWLNAVGKTTPIDLRVPSGQTCVAVVLDLHELVEKDNELA